LTLKPWENNSRNIPTHFVTIIIVIFEAMLPIPNDLVDARIIDFIPLAAIGLHATAKTCVPLIDV
jgi:hypothetical protein